jgi:hypothetical protein
VHRRKGEIVAVPDTYDHPYRDFFEWGIPLQAVLSAVVQRLVSHGMVGEFVLIH